MSYQSSLMIDNQTKSRVQQFEGFDFLRAIFAIAIVAYKTGSSGFKGISKSNEKDKLIV